LIGSCGRQAGLDRRCAAALRGRFEQPELLTLRASDKQWGAANAYESPDHVASMTRSRDGRLLPLWFRVIEA
jgi:hypothetical protein